MKLFLVLIGMALLTPELVAQDAVPRPTYNAALEGMSCKQSSVSKAQLDCDYRVGKDLHFVIAAVGEDDAAVTVLRTAGYDGDYYATFGVLHGCVIVKPGARSRRPSLPDFVFVSPMTGKVYLSWQECGQTTKSVPQN